MFSAAATENKDVHKVLAELQKKYNLGNMSTNYQSNLPEFTVSELNSRVKNTIESNFERVRVRGELGKVRYGRFGQLYAVIKERDSVIDVVMWSNQIERLGQFKPEEGMEVVVEGRMTTNVKFSGYQIVLQTIRPVGEGELLAMLEKLKKKLEKEGLFDSRHKKSLPALPKTIGVVTSREGAVIHDILHRVQDRFPVRVILWPTLVQGDIAPRQIENAIKGFNEIQDDSRPDVLIVGRGGGSVEDLWAFNAENVARAAFNSDIPLISAVGHESDSSILDLVADVRAPTPTAAAEMAVPVRQKLVELVGNLEHRLGRYFTYSISKYKERLKAAKLPRPETVIDMKRQKLEKLKLSLSHALRVATQEKRLRFSRASARLRTETLQSDISRKSDDLSKLAKRLQPATQRSLETKMQRLSAMSKMLMSLSYKSTLNRGFAVVRNGYPDDNEELQILSTVDEVKEAEGLQIEFQDGKIEVPSPRRRSIL